MSKKVIIVTSLFLLGLVLLPTLASAATLNLGTQYAAETGLTSTDIRTTVAKIINAALGLLGIIAVVIVLIGGFKWMLAGGNEEKVTEAKKLIGAGIVGLAIIIAAYAIASFVINVLLEASS